MPCCFRLCLCVVHCVAVATTAVLYQSQQISPSTIFFASCPKVNSSGFIYSHISLFGNFSQIEEWRCVRVCQFSGFKDFEGPGDSLAVCLLFVGMKCALAELTVNCLPISRAWQVTCEFVVWIVAVVNHKMEFSYLKYSH